MCKIFTQEDTVMGRKSIQITSIILSLLMILSVFATAPAFAADTAKSTVGDDTGSTGDLTYSFNSDTGAFILLGSGAMDDYSDDMTRPWYAYKDEIKSVAVGKDVTGIGDNAFYDCSNLTSVNIAGENLYSVGEYAFAYTKISSFEAPYCLTTVENGAFYRCTELAGVSLGSSITTLNSDIFYDCPFDSITIPSSVTTICSGAFRDCVNLMTISIPAATSLIEEQAFGGCTGLKYINIKPSNTSYYGSENNAIIDMTTDRLIVACENTVIPSTVKSIAAYTFQGLVGVTSIDLPAGLTEIEDYTFQGCTGLTELDIPDGVTKIGMGAFDLCEGVKTLILPSSVTYIDNYAFDHFQGLINIYYTGTEQEYQDLYGSTNGKYMGMGNHYYLAPEMKNHYYNYDRNHEHEYEDWFVWREATIYADGTLLRACIHCGYEDEAAIPMIKTIALAKKSYQYTGKAIKPKVTVKDRTGKVLKNGVDYTVEYSNNTKIGKGKARVQFQGSYGGAKGLYYKITKKTNTMKVKTAKKTVKFNTVKKKSVKVAPITVKKAVGTKTFKKLSGDKKITVNKKNGKFTVKKGIKKGTYKIKVKVSAKGNSTYKAASKTVTVKIVVK